MMDFRSFLTLDHSVTEVQYKINENCFSVDTSLLSSWRFDTEEEAVLAISLWLNTPEEKREINHFQHTFKNVLRMIGSNSRWSE